MSNITVFNSTPEQFETYQRKAKMMINATMFNQSGLLKNGSPDQKLANALIVLSVSEQMNVNPLTVNQQMYEIYGKPSFSSKFLIACMEKTGKFSALRYEFQGSTGQADYGCRAYATELATSEKLYGSWITMKMAKDEGWTSKKGSKWITMPEQMMRYRAASFFINTYCPSISMGFMTTEEIEDVEMMDITPQESTSKPTARKAKKKIEVPEMEAPSIPKQDEVKQKASPEPKECPEANQELLPPEDDEDGVYVTVNIPNSPEDGEEELF